MKKMDGKRLRKTPTMLTVAAMILTLMIAFPVSGICAMKAVATTVAADYSSAAHAVIDTEPAGGPRAVQTDLLPTSTSDVSVFAHGSFFYRVERFQADNITKFDIAEPDTPIWQFSTMDDAEAASANPHDLVFVSDQKAYLIRYGSTQAWIVNPSAATQADFKIGELDLSAYADGDGIPEMTSAVIANGKLFIAMQRLDRDNSWVPSNDSYVAVFDTTTDQEISTGTSNSDNLMGIVLPVRNVGAIQYLADNNMVYVQGVGDYGSSWTGRDPEYTGGIVTIDPDTYAVFQILDDGDADTHPYGNISGMSIVSPETGYFIGYAGYGDNSLYSFNPATGQVSGVANEYLTGKNISGMQAGTYADANGMLWVCNGTDAEVVILNTGDNSIDETVSTNLNPNKVVFVDVPSAQLSTDLELSISSMKYVDPNGTLYLSVNFQFIGYDEQSRMLWKLLNASIVDGSSSHSSTIAENFDISINCVEFAGQSMSATMAYQGTNESNDYTWSTTGLQFR